MKTAARRRYGLIVFSLFMLMMCWEYQWTHAALTPSSIPEEAIRLRILANSDSPQDQWIKRKVRDEIVKHMQTWVQSPQDIEEARLEVEARLDDFRQVVEETLAKYGYHDEVHVDFGTVDFPAKLYGNQIYPAGDYEALKVTIGSGEGRNWWCVLFPPLCFVEVASAEAVVQDQAASGDGAGVSDDSTEVRFFIIELLESLIYWIKGLFA